jgi:hypothetical protein
MIKLTPSTIANSVSKSDQTTIKNKYGFSNEHQVRRTIESYLQKPGKQDMSGDTLVRNLKDKKSSESLKQAVRDNSGTWPRG